MILISSVKCLFVATFYLKYSIKSSIDTPGKTNKQIFLSKELRHVSPNRILIERFFFFHFINASVGITHEWFCSREHSSQQLTPELPFSVNLMGRSMGMSKWLLCKTQMMTGAAWVWYWVLNSWITSISLNPHNLHFKKIIRNLYEEKIYHSIKAML